MAQSKSPFFFVVEMRKFAKNRITARDEPRVWLSSLVLRFPSERVIARARAPRDKRQGGRKRERAREEKRRVIERFHSCLALIILLKKILLILWKLLIIFWEFSAVF